MRKRLLPLAIIISSWNSPRTGRTVPYAEEGRCVVHRRYVAWFIELYQVDGNKVYLDSFARSLDYAWTHAREDNGLFNTDFTGKSCDNRKWLLTQAAMVEMYARLAVFANQSL